MQNYYIVDFSTFVYRFKSVYKFAYITKSGVKIDTSVLFGIIKSLKSNIYDNILIVLDGIPSRSRMLLPSYKGTRVKDDTFNSLSVPKLEVVKFLTTIGPLIHKNVTVLCSPLQETDEVISSLVHHITGNLPPRAVFLSSLNQRDIKSDRLLSYLDDGLSHKLFVPERGRAVIATTDGDFIQLQRFKDVYIDNSTSGKAVSNTWKSSSTHNLNPVASILYKAIYGDIGDNIPQLFPKDKELLELISKVTSAEQLNELMEALQQSRPSNELSLLYSKICCKANEVTRNYKVAFLKFVSYPYMLAYPDYDIRDTIKKYSLKV